MIGGKVLINLVFPEEIPRGGGKWGLLVVSLRRLLTTFLLLGLHVIQCEYLK